jgi:hypothetical protein
VKRRTGTRAQKPLDYMLGNIELRIKATRNMRQQYVRQQKNGNKQIVQLLPLSLINDAFVVYKPHQNGVIEYWLMLFIGALKKLVGMCTIQYRLFRT